jgi:hypothetical protein
LQICRALRFSFSTLIVYWFTIDGIVISSRIVKKEAKICNNLSFSHGFAFL